MLAMTWKLESLGNINTKEGSKHWNLLERYDYRFSLVAYRGQLGRGEERSKKQEEWLRVWIDKVLNGIDLTHEFNGNLWVISAFSCRNSGYIWNRYTQLTFFNQRKLGGRLIHMGPIDTFMPHHQEVHRKKPKKPNLLWCTWSKEERS